MEQQKSFAQAEYAQKKKTTRRERLLNEMEQVVPWARLVACIEPHYWPENQRKAARYIIHGISLKCYKLKMLLLV